MNAAEAPNNCSTMRGWPPSFVSGMIPSIYWHHSQRKEPMARAGGSISFSFILIPLFLCSPSPPSLASNPREKDPVPTPWPHQFHSILFMNSSGELQKVDLWYDWPNGRNFNIIQKQLGKQVYDLEWNNGTSFVYTLDSDRECQILLPGVGILRPDWLDGANYLGQRLMDGFLCNVWEKVDFIWYYEDVVTKRPVYWIFYSGYYAHVMTFEVGRALEDSHWQAPVYCFDGAELKKSSAVESG